jgi:hypothetical protein
MSSLSALTRAAFLASALAATAGLAACQNKEAAENDEIKKQLDQLVQTTKDLAGPVREIAGASKTNADAVKALAGRVDEMHKDLAAALAKQKRGALSLTLDVETTCDNDPQCVNTARALCNRINYPNAITSRFTPGVRPVLNALICFD